MKITVDKEFQNRQELDHFVISRLGDNKDENIKHEIEVSEEEGKKLGLSEKVNVHGVRIIIKEDNKEENVQKNNSGGAGVSGKVS